MSLVINSICGGGAGVRFVIGDTEPASGLDKTIWVQTTVSIPAYVFSYDQPSGTPANGTIWVKTGNSSPVAFNALNGNDVLMIYPTQCKQYISGAWVAKTAKSYLNNGWQDWAVWLFMAGTGQIVEWSSYRLSTTVSTVTFGTDNITLSCSQDGYSERAAYIANNVDVTDISTVYFDVECTTRTSGNLKFGVTTDSTIDYNPPSGTFASPSNSSRQTISVDVSDLSGNARVIVWARLTGTEKVYNVYMS